MRLFTPGDLSVLVAVSSRTRGLYEAADKTRYSQGNSTFLRGGLGRRTAGSSVVSRSPRWLVGLLSALRGWLSVPGRIVQALSLPRQTISEAAVLRKIFLSWRSFLIIGMLISLKVRPPK